MTETTIEELVEAAKLLDVSTFELGATRVEATEGAEPGPVQPDHEVEVQTRGDGAAVRIMFRTSIEVENVGGISSCQAIEYEFDGVDMHQVDVAVMEEFVNNVAIMAVLPFAREAVADITQRVFGASLLMPIMQRGAITVTLQRTNELETGDEAVPGDEVD